MILVHEVRASTILYNLLRTSSQRRPWLLPANVCPIVPLTFLKAGCEFEFVDIDETSLCMSSEDLLTRLRRERGHFGGVLFVRTYGVADSFDAFFADVKEIAPDSLLVDDRCLCAPDFDALSAGFADVLLYSTGYAKPVDLGWGGFALCKPHVPYRRHELPYRAAALESLSADYKTAIQQGQRLQYADSEWLATNTPSMPADEYRELVAQRWAKTLALKQRINRIYREGLPESIRLDDRFQNWRFHILVTRKEELLATIFARGLFASSHYADLTGIFSRGASPMAAGLHERVVNLFNDNYFSVEKAARIVEIVRKHIDT